MNNETISQDQQCLVFALFFNHRCKKRNPKKFEFCGANREKWNENIDSLVVWDTCDSSKFDILVMVPNEQFIKGPSDCI
jgi:hypothetical protein